MNYNPLKYVMTLIHNFQMKQVQIILLSVLDLKFNLHKKHVVSKVVQILEIYNAIAKNDFVAFLNGEVVMQLCAMNIQILEMIFALRNNMKMMILLNLLKHANNNDAKLKLLLRFSFKMCFLYCLYYYLL